MKQLPKTSRPLQKRPQMSFKKTFHKNGIDNLEEVKNHLESCYPLEGCGVIVKDRFLPLVNVIKDQISPVLASERQGKPAKGFSFDPNEFSKVAHLTTGIVHSHPDCEAIPSETDKNQPFLNGWDVLIAKIEKGKFKEMRHWKRESPEEDFKEVYG